MVKFNKVSSVCSVLQLLHQSSCNLFANLRKKVQYILCSLGWTRLAVVPHEANQLSIHISTPVSLNIAIRERRRDRPILELIKHSKRFELDNTQDKYLKYDPNVPQNLRIIEVDSNIIDIKEGEHFGYEGMVVAAGSVVRWKKTDSDVELTSSSRLQTDLMILVSNLIRCLVVWFTI